MSCIITYQKNNGDIIYRPCKHSYGKRVGDETSMGWKVVDIHYKYKGNYYLYDDFYRMINREESPRKKLIRFVVKKLNNYI